MIVFFDKRYSNPLQLRLVFQYDIKYVLTIYLSQKCTVMIGQYFDSNQRMKKISRK